MACPEFETRIPEYLEDQLPAAARGEVEAHLAGCPACRQFVRQWQQLDSALTRGMARPVLPPDFNTRLHRRIQAAGIFSETERAKRKRELEAEFDARMSLIRKTSLNPAAFLRSFAWAALAALACWLFFTFAPAWSSALAQHGPAPSLQALLFSSSLSVVFVFFGLASLFPRQFRRLWLMV